MSTRCGLPLLALLSLVACRTDAPERRGPTVRDSAGIRIVENTTPLWQEGEEWRMSEEPVVDIGGGDTEEEHLFQVVGATRLADGRVAVANAGSHELRFYSESGVFLHAAGGQGDGPGEFQRLLWLQRYAGDSLVTFDIGQLRISFFDAAGKLARTVNLRATEEVAAPIARGMFSDGSFLAVAAVRLPAQPTSGTTRPPAAIYWYSTSGDSSLHVGTYPSLESFVQVRADGRYGRASPFFGRTSRFVVHNSSIYAGDNAHYEVHVLGPRGALMTIIRKEHDPIPVTPADIEAVHEDRLRQYDDDQTRDVMERWYREIPEPDEFPAFSSFNVDDQGGLWIRRYDRPGDDVPKWDVFDAEGQWLGTLTMPPGFEPLDIGSDYVLGLWRDADDVEHVRMYELVKSERR